MLSGKIYPNGEYWVGFVPESYMGLVDPAKNHSTPRNEAGMNSNARRTVRQGAFELGDVIGCENLTFFTGTLPGDTDEECRQALEAWPDLTRQFLQSIGRELDRAGLPRWIVGCTEIQPKRYESTGQPWPHIHLLFPARGRGRWLLPRWRINALWINACCNVLGGNRDRYRIAPRCDRIDDDADKLGKYLSKYMGKSSEALIVNARGEGWELPRNWHHCTHELSRRVKQDTTTLTAKTAAWLFHCSRSQQEGCNVWAAIERPANDEREVSPVVGYVGNLDKEFCYRVLLFNVEDKAA